MCRAGSQPRHTARDTPLQRSEQLRRWWLLQGPAPDGGRDRGRGWGWWGPWQRSGGGGGHVGREGGREQVVYAPPHRPTLPLIPGPSQRLSAQSARKAAALGLGLLCRRCRAQRPCLGPLSRAPGAGVEPRPRRTPCPQPESSSPPTSWKSHCLETGAGKSRAWETPSPSPEGGVEGSGEPAEARAGHSWSGWRSGCAGSIGVKRLHRVPHVSCVPVCALSVTEQS